MKIQTRCMLSWVAIKKTCNYFYQQANWLFFVFFYISAVLHRVHITNRINSKLFPSSTSILLQIHIFSIACSQWCPYILSCCFAADMYNKSRQTKKAEPPYHKKMMGKFQTYSAYNTKTRSMEVSERELADQTLCAVTYSNTSTQYHTSVIRLSVLHWFKNDCAVLLCVVCQHYK